MRDARCCPSPNFRTLESEKQMSMLDWYVALVRSKAAELLSLTDILVADAFFSKYEFVNEVIGMGFRFVGRLRANSYLRYLAIPDSPPPRKTRAERKSMERKWISPTLICPCSLPFIYEDSKGNQNPMSHGGSYIRGHLNATSVSCLSG